MATKTAKLVVELLDRLTAPSRAITASISKLTAASEANARRMSALRGRMFDAAGAGYVLARAISSPVKAAGEFQEQMDGIRQKADLTTKQLAMVGETARRVGAATGQGATEIGKAIDFMLGMGSTVDQATAAAAPIGKAATAYSAATKDLASASFAVIDNLKVPAQQTAQALDIMAEAGKAGGFELKDMAERFPSITAAAQALGIKGTKGVADLTAALEVARKGAADGSTAANNMQNFLSKIVSKETLKNFHKFGVDVPRELRKAAKAGESPIEHMLGVIDKLTEGGRPEKLAQLFSDMQVQQFIRPMLANMKLYRDIRKQALDASGVVEADFQKRMQTYAGVLARFNAQLLNMKITIGNALLPALSRLMEVIGPFVTSISELAQRFPQVTKAVVALTAGVIGFRVAAIAAQFAGLFLKGAVLDIGIAALRSARFMLGLLNPIKLVTGAFRVLKLAVIGTGIGAIIVAIAAAGVWIYENWSGIAEMFRAFGAAFMEAIGPVMPVLQPVIDGIKSLYNWVTSLLGPIDQTGEGWRNAGKAAGEFVGSVVRWIAELPAKITALAADMIEAGKELMLSLLAGIKAGAAEVIDYVKGIGSRIKSGITGAASSAWSSVKNAVGIGGDSPAVAGAKAAGGPVRAGLPYLVGERGPEVVTFAQDGFVHDAVKTARMMRNAALASAVAIPAATMPAAASSTPRAAQTAPVVNLTINATTNADAAEIAGEVKRVLSHELDALSRGAYSDGSN